MAPPRPWIVRVLLCLYTILSLHNCAYAQQHVLRDTLQPISKATIINMRQALYTQRKAVGDALHAQLRSVQAPIPISFNNLFKQRPVVRLNSAYTSYNFTYRSLIDTPFTQKDLLQHTITGSMDLSVFRVLPLQVRYRVLQTNSPFYKNSYDVQASFNVRAFQNNLQATVRASLLAMAPSFNDTLTQQLYQLKLQQLTGIGSQLKTLFAPQQLIEAHEILKVPHYTWNNNKPDSINRQHEDSLRTTAADLLCRYEQTKQQYDQLKGRVDSLKQKCDQAVTKANQFRQLLNGNVNEWKDQLPQYGLSQDVIPARYRWLLGVRNFSLGRSPVTYSELTAKNVSVNGLNFEYNSWYYLAITAGTVNYQFRDFATRTRRRPQYITMLRLGVGRLEKNYFILSGFHGQKQLYGNSTIRLSGLSAEGRWAVNRFTYVTAEVAKSAAPDYRNNPAITGNKLSLSDNNAQAVALHACTNLPAIGARLEGFYKKTGANYQSFSSYTTSAAAESWSIKADQTFFKKRIRISAAIKKNEFTNPFVQQYTSNTLFKSATAMLRMRKWPVITLGYQPLSQLTKIGDQVLENQFQTFTATAYHQYKIKALQMNSTVMVNRFYNTSADTGFIYYNATNAYGAQSFIFSSFTANVAASITKNSSYTLQVLEGGVQPIIPRLGTIGMGVKISNLNNTTIKAGAYCNASITLFKRDMLMLYYEHGYLPGNAHQLVRNEMGTVQFIKTFNF